MKLEVEELQKEIKNYVEQLKTVDDTIQQYEEQIQELLDKMKSTKVLIENKNVLLRYNEQNYGKKSLNSDCQQFHQYHGEQELLGAFI